jgi:hypothetical protein
MKLKETTIVADAETNTPEIQQKKTTTSKAPARKIIEKVIEKSDDEDDGEEEVIERIIIKKRAPKQQPKVEPDLIEKSNKELLLQQLKQQERQRIMNDLFSF